MNLRDTEGLILAKKLAPHCGVMMVKGKLGIMADMGWTMKICANSNPILFSALFEPPAKLGLSHASPLITASPRLIRVFINNRWHW
ncbi:MAG: hypothetical protein COA75_01460 [Cellvibrionales bacterium]|nr:MAG: hypothetical protein COA75_01460 [Cellvibrionales bacterium]